MKDNEIKFPEIDESLFEVQLDSVPSTEELKSRILQTTETLPQLHNADIVQKPLVGQELSANEEPSANEKSSAGEKSLTLQQPSTLIKFLKPKYIAPLAVAASVALVAILWVPTANQQSLNHSTAAVIHGGFSTSDNLDFEEAMVLYDEELFAQL